MQRKTDPETEPRLPIKLDPVSNGEFEPLARTDLIREAQMVALEQADRNARRTGLSRRDFLSSACGAATTLLALNAACARRGGGGRYDVPREATLEPAAAQTALGGKEFIFDVQTHHVNPARDWHLRNPHFRFLESTEQAQCGEKSFLGCYSTDHFIKEVFLDSETSIAVLSALFDVDENVPLTLAEMEQTREAVEKLGPGRLHLHAQVLPNAMPIQRALEGMQSAVERFPIKAWKLYPVWGPTGKGYRLDDEKTGIPVLEQARRLGVRRVAVHKGLTLMGMDPRFSECEDVGVVAKRYPDIDFLVYHSGVELRLPEGPFDPGRAKGLDSLIVALQRNAIARDANVYADLGAVWKILMGEPEVAAHMIGKLLKHLGEDRVLWGTDSIWFGSPQDQIQAFRAFQIDDRLREQHGYPQLTPQARRKIFGLNGARVYGVDVPKARAMLDRDGLTKARAAYAERPLPSHRTYGPRTRRELLALWRSRGGAP